MLKKKILKGFLGTLVLAGSLLAAGCSNEGDTENDVAMENAMWYIPIVDTGAYWTLIRQGAEEMAEEMGQNLVTRILDWDNPQRNEIQIGFIHEAISNNAAAIALAPIDSNMMDRAVGEAAEANIPVVTFDADIATKANRVSYVGTDNMLAGEELGRRAAEYMLENGVTEGSIAMVMTSLTQTTMIHRQEGIQRGFNEIMGANAENFTWLESIADDNQSSISMPQVEAYIVANPDLVTLFSLGGEGPTTGTMEALRSQDRGGEIFHFGFDFTDTWLNGVDEGLVTGIVDQDPFEIGRQLIRTMNDIIEGNPVEEVYPIPVTWILAEDIEAHGEWIQERVGTE